MYERTLPDEGRPHSLPQICATALRLSYFHLCSHSTQRARSAAGAPEGADKNGATALNYAREERPVHPVPQELWCAADSLSAGGFVLLKRAVLINVGAQTLCRTAASSLAILRVHFTLSNLYFSAREGQSVFPAARSRSDCRLDPGTETRQEVPQMSQKPFICRPYLCFRSLAGFVQPSLICFCCRLDRARRCRRCLPACLSCSCADRLTWFSGSLWPKKK